MSRGTVGIRANIPDLNYGVWKTLLTPSAIGGAPVQFTAKNIFFSKAFFCPFSAFDETGVASPPFTVNNAPVYFGHKTKTGFCLPYTLEANELGYLPVEPATGMSLNLKDYFFNGTTGDKILVIYLTDHEIERNI